MKLSSWWIIAPGFALLVGACGSGEAEYPVVSAVVEADQGQHDVLVFAPDSEGEWPVVVALHGRNASGVAMAETATRLARTGLVAFAPSYESGEIDAAGQAQSRADIECGYRRAIEAAAEYGGDLNLPLTLVGHSLGARLALLVGLAADDVLSACSAEVPAPDVVVAVSGCYFESRNGVQFEFDPSSWANRDANVLLIGGEADDVCPLSQTERAAEVLRGNGYTVDVKVIPGASHLAPIFHELDNGNFVPAPEDPVGIQVVDIIVEAIE